MQVREYYGWDAVGKLIGGHAPHRPSSITNSALLQDFSQTGFTPFQILEQSIRPENLIGEGHESKTYQIPIKGLENYILRTSKYRTGTEDLKNTVELRDYNSELAEVKDAGFPLGEIGDIQILRFIDGEGVMDPIGKTIDKEYKPFWEFLELIMRFNDPTMLDNLDKRVQEGLVSPKVNNTYKRFCELYTNRMEQLASMPPRAYEDLVSLVKLLNESGLRLDTAPNNFFILRNGVGFGIIDPRINSTSHQDTALEILTGILIMNGHFNFPLFVRIPETRTQASLHIKSIVEKVLAAAQKRGLPPIDEYSEGWRSIKRLMPKC